MAVRKIEKKTKKSKNFKSLPILIGGLMIALTILVTSTLYLFNNGREQSNDLLSALRITNPTLTPTPTLTLEEGENPRWSTFVNKKYGYSVMHPTAGIVYTMKAPDYKIVETMQAHHTIPPKEEGFVDFRYLPAYGPPSLYVSIFNEDGSPLNKDGNSSVQNETFKKISSLKVGEEIGYESYSPTGKVVPATYKRLPDIYSNDISFIAIQDTGGFFGNNNILFTIHNNKLYEIGESAPKRTSFSDDFKRFYSSFKFID